MPVETFPEYDLGNLADRDTATEDDRAKFEKWRGWKVVYRANIYTSAVHELRSGDVDRAMAVLASVILGWNFVDEEGNPLPQPTRSNFYGLGLPDDLIAALMYGFAEVFANPKAP